MATPGQLVETMATVLGIPAATVAQYDRQLSEAGLRSKGGRGRSAARVTASDATNLLIAILASPVAGAAISSAADTCRTFGALRHRHSAGARNFAKFGLSSLDKLTAQHSLAEALAVLIERAGEGETFYVRDGRDKVEADFAWGLRVQGPWPWAEMVCDGSLGEQRQAKMARLIYAPQNVDRESGLGPDLNQERFVTFRTIRALGHLVMATRAAHQRSVTGG